MTTLLLLQSELSTPLGKLILMHDESGNLRAADWDEYAARLPALLQRQYRDIDLKIQPHVTTKAHLNHERFTRYFDGDLHALEAIPLQLGGTDFQQQVWLALRHIPVGATWSYKDLASFISRPKACRAVGAANGLNPVAIVLPCHRVIGSSGSMVGYASGLARKRWLLQHEQALTSTQSSLFGTS